MSDAGGRIREVRASEVAFINDPDRTHPRWFWSPGVGYVLDVDYPDSPVIAQLSRCMIGAAERWRPDWRREARESGETWVSRSSEAIRAILMRERRQKHPLIRATIYVTQPSRMGLREQALHLIAVRDAHEDFYVWTNPEDLKAPASGRLQSSAS